MKPESSVNTPATPSEAAQETRIVPRLRLRLPLFLLLAVVAGAVFLGIYLTAFPFYRVPEHLLRMFPSDEDAQAREVAFRWATTVHVTVGLAIFGVLLAGLLGSGEAMTRRGEPGVPGRVVVGVVLAALLGALGGLLGGLLAIALEPLHENNPMARTMMTHAVMLGLLGAGVGLSVGWVTGSGRGAGSWAGAGLASGILTAVVFPLVCAFGLPHLQIDAVVPDGSGGISGCVSNRGLQGLIVWIGSMSVILGLLLPLTGSRQKQATSPAE